MVANVLLNYGPLKGFSQHFCFLSYHSATSALRPFVNPLLLTFQTFETEQMRISARIRSSRNFLGGLRALKGVMPGSPSIVSRSLSVPAVASQHGVTWATRLQQERDFKPSWGDGPPPVGMEPAPQELLDILFAKKKTSFSYEREQFPLRKQYLCQSYCELLEKSGFLFIFSHSLKPAQLAEWTANIGAATNSRVKFKSSVKNKVARVACETHQEGKWTPLAAAFHSQTCIVYSMDSESVFADVKQLVQKIPKDGSVLLLGGKLDSTILNHEQISEVSKLNSAADLHYQLIGVLSNAGNSLIRVLQTPANTLVKVLDSQVPKEEVEE